MSVETALEELLNMMRRRTMNIAALPPDEREVHYELIYGSCRRAAEQIGQSSENAADTAEKMVEFTRAVVGIIDAGGSLVDAGQSGSASARR